MWYNQLSKNIFRALLVFILFSVNNAHGQSTTYRADLTVSQDGSGDFKTIQEAINAVRDLSQQRVTIHIKKGVYHEKIVIPTWKSKIFLLGEDAQNTIITNDDFSGKPRPGW
jgi:pectinesterase